MYLIADSGSSKTEWCIAHNSHTIKHIVTAGINPYFQTPEEIAQDIRHALLPQLKDFNLTAVHFYGAGCTLEKCKIMSGALGAVLPVPVEVSSDLLGAARALCQQQEGIACILGTGSNSCHFDGKDIAEHVPPLGYILGDEGSGASLGKILVSDCLRERLPGSIIRRFMQRYALTQEIIMDNIYHKPYPNRFLASLSPFLAEHLNEPSLYHIVRSELERFFTRNVLAYKHTGSLPVHFTGGVAFAYREVLRDIAQSFKLKTGTISASPMEGLMVYHGREKD